MNPDQLANLLTSPLRAALEKSKAEILASLSPIQRAAVRLLWGLILARLVPLVAAVAAKIVFAWLERLAGDAPREDQLREFAAVAAIALEREVGAP